MNHGMRWVLMVMALLLSGCATGQYQQADNRNDAPCYTNTCGKVPPGAFD